MGNYNPSAPIVLGEEWVGIRDETLAFSTGIPDTEVGHRFTLGQSRTLSTGKFYLNDLPSSNAQGSVLMMNIYPAGAEEDSGPVQSVIIPCNNGSVTAGSGGLFPVTFENATGFADAVSSPSDNKYIKFYTGGDSTSYSKIKAYFAVNNYAAALNGKRILGVNLLYSISSLNYLRSFDVRPGILAAITNDSGSGQTYGTSDDGGVFGNMTLGTALGFAIPPERLYLGSFNIAWDPTATPTTERLPWTFTNLARMEISGTNRYGILIFGSGTGTGVVASSIEYLALEVFYCEERRVAVGGTSFGVGTQAWVHNTNSIVMRTPAETLNPVLAAGDYTMTLSLESIGYDAPTESPVINALRETETLDVHEGIRVLRPFPLDDTIIGQTFESETVHVLPQLSLHTSGAPLTEVHVYGRQAQAPVYGSITATQEILDSPAGGATSFPQVRFYARRFGDTTVSLTLDSPSITGSSASITPTEFDALDEIVDGWKEITLRFTTPPSMGAGTNPQWRFSATGEVAGNQWQVLGMTAPALSGITSSPIYNTVPSAQLLTTATYGAPSAGSTINLGWMYPLVSSTTDDATSDAALLFSQDPPLVTNFAVSVEEQELSTVDPECFAAACVPTSLYYNEVSWTAITSPTAITGFGSYELQRYDPVDGDFSTIMRATDYTLTTFNDYEARVGYPSVYRIRTVNLYDFASLWSTQVTGTVTEPGVVGGDTALMLFTTNSHQDGSGNLAYSAAWTGTPVEEYVWPESAEVVLQNMFGKDYPTAFRPLERGGERFARQILVNASGIPPATTQHGFESLRDMAWDTVPYVCVRNEDGDRWYSTVVVPGGSVRRMIATGRLCIANVQVIETTDTPYPVNP